ncbi:MAG: hypothetical protein ABSD98_16725 [Candidatus Korobacteraceae bacterium]|jgi:hypothetical protein
MKSVLLFVFAVCAVVLLGFAVHDIVSLRMGIFGSASHAPKQFWDAVVDAVAWGMEYKEAATVIFIICLLALYAASNPRIRN